MTKQFIFSTLFIFLAQFAFAQSGILGTWKTVDDVDGSEKSYITITEEDGKYIGTISKLLKSAPDKLCDACPGDKKNQPLMGMKIVEDLEVYKDYYSYGSILDPETGKLYKCSIWVDNDDQLTVRGYVGISALGRSQNWFRVK